MFRVQGIPMVYRGRRRPAGRRASPACCPRRSCGSGIDAVLKAGGVEVAEPEDPRLDAADDALMTGDLDAAEAAYRKILAESPGGRRGRGRAGPGRAVPPGRPASTRQTALAAADADPDDVAAQLLAADVEVLSGQAEQAYARLVALVRRTAGDERETVRKHLVSLFTVAGPDDPAVAGARRRARCAPARCF